MLDRRGFLKVAAAASGSATINPLTALASRYQDSTGFFGVHSFIQNNPNAVFIMRTNVDVKTNSDACKTTGMNFGRSVFVPKTAEEGGVPLTHLVPIKPNLTQRGDWMRNRKTFEGETVNTFDIEQSMGIVTDAYFVEGIIESMKELGLSGSQFHLREANAPQHFEYAGYESMCDRTGANIKSNVGGASFTNENVQWSEVPNGVWFEQMAHLWPVNAPDTFMLNVAKFKAHEMGLTLAAKNLQGSCFSPYQQHCTAWNQTWRNLVSGTYKTNAKTVIQENYNRHVADGIPRWDRAPAGLYDKYTGIGQETWAARNLDNNTVTKPALHIIEGIYGRDGDFLYGPNEPFFDDQYEGMAQDYMTNIIIFGLNPYYMDIIGHWLGGHEPGNMGLYHIAKERGFIDFLNPFDVPLYEWNAETCAATLTSLDQFERTELKTIYLRKDYGEYAEDPEPFWHLVNEPFDYDPIPVGINSIDKPEMVLLSQNRPNPFNPTTSIEYKLPVSGNVRIEIYNMSGQLVDVVADGFRAAGSHMAVWNTNGQSSGTYFYRLRFNGHTETRRMTLLK